MQLPRRRLRATRASPPGLASDDADRRATYSAALQQFDDLIDAARAIGPVSRPLPLYYAVHQAGKAIAAAWVADDWRVRGHGLTEHIQRRTDREDQLEEWRGDILCFRVKPQSRPGVFGAVAQTLSVSRRTLTGSVELGALWAALPNARSLEVMGRWPLALPVYPILESTSYGSPDWVTVFFGERPKDAEAVSQRLAIYPDAAGAQATTYQGNLQLKPTPYGPGVAVMLPPGRSYCQDLWIKIFKLLPARRSRRVVR